LFVKALTHAKTYQSQTVDAHEWNTWDKNKNSTNRVHLHLDYH
jgi:hypothetical protein